MPIYEYLCASCGFQREYLQKMSDAPLTDCPECGKATLGKMVTAAGFHLKGSGWYVTDFKHGAKQKSKSDDQSGAKPNEGPSAKADEKPAAKAEDKPAATTDAKPAPEAPAKKAGESPAAAKTGTSSVSG